MRPVSKKRASTLAERERVRTHVLERDGGCVFWPTAWGERGRTEWIAGDLLTAPQACDWGALAVHEVIQRSVRPGSELEPDLCVTLCQRHHLWCHENIAEATRLGLLAPSWAASEFKEGRRL